MGCLTTTATTPGSEDNSQMDTPDTDETSNHLTIPTTTAPIYNKEGKKLPCIHCGKMRWGHKRFCYWCYKDPSVKLLYPLNRKQPASKVGQPGTRGRFTRTIVSRACGGMRPLPTEPTKYLPGTPEKIQVLANRAMMGQQLYHPDDATFGSLGLDVSLSTLSSSKDGSLTPCRILVDARAQRRLRDIVKDDKG